MSPSSSSSASPVPGGPSGAMVIPPLPRRTRRSRRPVHTPPPVAAAPMFTAAGAPPVPTKPPVAQALKRRHSADATAPPSTDDHATKRDDPFAPDRLAAMGYHAFECFGVPFHVQQRYTFIKPLGVGSYGCVALAHDSVLDVTVAIKKMNCIFNSSGTARHALREVAILRHLSMCDNSTVLLDFDATFVEFAEIYLVMAPSEANLSQIIRSKQSLSNAHLQYFAVQLLRGVRYMHGAHIVHRDLKPGNLLVNADCALRICDYGLARAWSDLPNDHSNNRAPALQHAASAEALSNQYAQDAPPLSASAPGHLRIHTGIQPTRLFYPGEPLSGYVATRWYRSPEILLQFKEGYGPEMDMWAVGCILAELILGKPLFPGKDYVDQLSLIYNVLGSPTPELVSKSSSTSAQKLMGSWGARPPANLHAVFATTQVDPLAVDLIAQLVRWDPMHRLSAAEALQHPWLEPYHESSAQWTPPPPFAAFGQVEFSSHCSGFIQAFQAEQREMHAEWSALAQESGMTMDFSALHLSPARTMTEDSSDELQHEACRSSSRSVRNMRSMNSIVSHPVRRDSRSRSSRDEEWAVKSDNSADRQSPTSVPSPPDYGTGITTPSGETDQGRVTDLTKHRALLAMTAVDACTDDCASLTPNHGLEVEHASSIPL